MGAVNILPGPKTNNNNNHIVAYRAVIKVFFSFHSEGFPSRVTVFHLEKVSAHNCLGLAGQQESAWKPAIDHTSQVTPCWTGKMAAVQCFTGILAW